MPSTYVPTADQARKIARVASLTKSMRAAQARIDAAARERDNLVGDLLHAGVPQSVIAKQADVTTHALTKSLRKVGAMPAR